MSEVDNVQAAPHVTACITPPPLLIALPGGLYVSGVVTWAVQLANALVAAGGRAGLLVHALRAGYAPASPVIDARVRLFDLSELGDFEQGTIDLDGCREAYAHAVLELRGCDEGPVVVSPNLHGDCYGVCASLTLNDNICGQVRLLGWCHLDSSYDLRMLSYFAPVLSRVAAVSSRLHTLLAAELSGHEVTVDEVAYGVRLRSGPPIESLTGSPPRIIYSGRMDQTVKRVGILPALSLELARRGIRHELMLVGDGPENHAMDSAIELMKQCRRDEDSVNDYIMTRRGATPECQLGELLASSELFVLPSTAEGLSLSMLEAMGAGCIPVVTAVRSGPAQVITHNVNGYLVEAGDTAQNITSAFADVITEHLRRPAADRAAMRESARSAAAVYSMSAHVARVRVLLEQAVRGQPKRWPQSRPWGFTSNAVVGPGGATRLVEALKRLTTHGASVAIYGAGNHTLQLKHILEPYLDRIACFADDSPRSNQLLGRPLVALKDVASHRVSSLIVSSCIHAEQMYQNAHRSLPGLQIVTLYDQSVVAA